MPCWFRSAGIRTESSSSLQPSRHSMGLGRDGSNLFQSFDDLGPLLVQEPGHQRRLADELGATLRALKQSDLPPGGEEACGRIAADLRRLEEILDGPSSAASTRAASSAGVVEPDGEPDVKAVDSKRVGEKAQLLKVIAAAQMQKELSLQPGSLAPALNEMIRILWPRIGAYVEELVQNSIEPSINAALPGMLKGGVKFTKVSLGASSPLLGPLVVENNKETGAIEMHMGIDFSSDLDVELTAMGIPVGITSMYIKGDLVFLFTPEMKKPPFFGGIQVYFPNAPDVGLNFVGAARVADVPGLRTAVRGAIDGAVAGACVLPRRIAVDMNDEDDVDITDLTYPEPIGILRFTLWSGTNLIAADTNVFGAASSDPYVVASLGIKSWTSPTITKSLNPEWGDGEGLTADFLVHSDCQVLSLKVFDHDFASADDLIGIAKSVDVRDLVKRGGKQAVELLKDSGEQGGGKLFVSATLLSLSPAVCMVPLPPGPSEAFLSVKLLTLQGLEDGAEYPFKVRVQVTVPSSDSQVSGRANAPAKRAAFARTASAKLRASKSLTFGTPANNALAEGTTGPSHAQAQKELAEALRGIATTLSQKGHSAEDIADILGVGTRQVELFLDTLFGHGKEHEQAYQAWLSTRHPRFDEVVQILLPHGAADPLANLELAILDKRLKTLATARLPMEQLVEAKERQLEGPFSTDVEGVEIVGSLKLRWLLA